MVTTDITLQICKEQLLILASSKKKTRTLHQKCVIGGKPARVSNGVMKLESIKF